jgi:hypothetical protein
MLCIDIKWTIPEIAPANVCTANAIRGDLRKSVEAGVGGRVANWHTVRLPLSWHLMQGRNEEKNKSCSAPRD